MKPDRKYQIRYYHFLNIPVLRNSKKILDVGCGTGELTEEVASLNKKAIITACDTNKKSLDLFKRRTGVKNVQITIANAENLKFTKSYFDSVFMFDVLEHTKNPDKVLSEIKRVVKHGGIFHLVVPCEADLVTVDGWINKLFNLNLKKKPIGHIQQFTFNEIRNLLDKNGFKLKKVKYSYFLLYQLISLVYYSYSNLFNKGRYVEILDGGNKPGLIFLKPFIILGGYLINLENFIFGNLGFRGQTAHITSLRI